MFFLMRVPWSLRIHNVLTQMLKLLLISTYRLDLPLNLAVSALKLIVLNYIVNALPRVNSVILTVFVFVVEIVQVLRTKSLMQRVLWTIVNQDISRAYLNMFQLESVRVKNPFAERNIVSATMQDWSAQRSVNAVIAIMANLKLT